MNATALSEMARAPVTPAEAAELRFIDPGKLKFHKDGSVLRLTVDGEKSLLKAVVVRAFPLSHPDRYLSVRDGGGDEVGVLRSVEELDPESRRLVEEQLGWRYFMPVVRRIREVIERFGTVEWRVDTDRGPCRFTTRDLRDNVVRLGAGRYIMVDVDENRYEVPDVSRLDTKSASRLLRYL